MLDAGKQAALRHTVASQLVGHDDPRHILQTLPQQPLEESASRRWHRAGPEPKCIERDTILIDGAPEIVLHAADPDEDHFSVHVPLVPWPWPAASQAVGEALAEFLAPAPYGLVGDDPKMQIYSAQIHAPIGGVAQRLPYDADMGETKFLVIRERDGRVSVEMMTTKPNGRPRVFPDFRDEARSRGPGGICA